MNTTPTSGPNPNRRALVLGGGGSTGNAWLIGVVAGLHDAGVDLTDADLFVGTSAGATAAAQIVGASPPELFAATIASAPPAGSGPGATIDHLGRLRDTIAESADLADFRRRMGAQSLERPDISERWRSIVAARLPQPHWPDRNVAITAVDATTGEPAVFGPDSGVDLVDAVAASCAGGFAYAIGPDRYIDGGYRRSAENADLAAGYEQVLVLSPLGGRTLHPPQWGTDLATQVAELVAGGSWVETIVPGEDGEHLFGANAMDASLRPAAAQLGYDQARSLAERIGSFHPR